MADALTDDALVSILRKEEQAAVNWNTDALQSVRDQSINAYDRKPYGTEQDGQSKVVTSEFSDTVESVMPSLMRVFASGEEIVEFQPDSRQDQVAADEASEYVPHVVMRENDGFRVLYWFLKDALMSRLGVVTVDVEESEEVKTSPVERWTAEQVQMAPGLAEEAGASAELDVTEDEAGEPVPMLDAVTGAPTGEMVAAPQTFSGTITTKRKKKRVCIDNVPPEDLMITPDARDIDSASFVGYRKRVTASELRRMGVSLEDIDELSSDRSQSQEQTQRDDGTTAGRAVRDNRGDSERPLWLVRAYVLADEDGDGISERLCVLYAHAGGMAGKIIERMEWEDKEVPITIGSPILMPHTIVGRSLFDQTSDIQEVSTAITRGMLDNVYATNRPRPVITDKVDINMLLDWTPGMPIPVKGGSGIVGDHVSWLQVPSIVAPAIAALEYMGTVKERRTGITSYNQGLDAESLNKTLGGIDRIMSAAQQRMELIARVFAETAIKRLCRHVYRAVKRCATGEVEYYAGSDWKKCDPTKWPSDMDLAVNVGGATGNKQQEMQNLGLIGAGQKALIEAQGGVNGPLVRMDHIANTFRKMCEAAGFKGTQEFVASAREVAEAGKQQAQQQTVSPEMQKAQAEIEVKRAMARADIQLEREKAAAQVQLMREKAAAEIEIARMKAGLDAQLKSQELQAEVALEAADIATRPKPNIEQQQLNG